MLLSESDRRVRFGRHAIPPHDPLLEFLRDRFPPGLQVAERHLPFAVIGDKVMPLDPIALRSASQLLTSDLEEKEFRFQDVLLLQGLHGTLHPYEPYLVAAARERCPTQTIRSTILAVAEPKDDE